MDNLITLFQTETWFFLLTIALTSVSIGSFLNVVIYRLPKMMTNQWQSECRIELADELKSPTVPNSDAFNLIIPNSTCPNCKQPIKVWHNIPILSWLFLKGKCAYCSTLISVRYPLIELGTMLCSLWIASHFGVSYATVLYLVVTWFLITLVFIDIDHMLLPDQITLPLLWLVLVASTFGITIPPEQSILGAAVGYLSLWSVYWLFKIITGKEGMGYGDFKLLAVFGALLGWQALPLIIILSSFVGAIIGSLQLALQGKDKGTPIPFGPYIAIAGWLALLYGKQIQNWYYNLIM